MNKIATNGRKSIRLKGYDYSLAGYYFVTICIQDRKCILGSIKDGEIILNEAGRIIKKRYNEIPNKFRDIALDAFVIMPNHFHAIIINTGVGADLCVCPDGEGEHTGSPPPVKTDEHIYEGEHTGSPLHVEL